jgi:phosphate uptake regulator
MSVCLETPSPSDDLRRLAVMVRDMRKAQREYFRTRDNRILQHSKNLERDVDALVNELLAQPTLF